jgi:hypothetical protein
MFTTEGHRLLHRVVVRSRRVPQVPRAPPAQDCARRRPGAAPARPALLGAHPVRQPFGLQRGDDEKRGDADSGGLREDKPEAVQHASRIAQKAARQRPADARADRERSCKSFLFHVLAARIVDFREARRYNRALPRFPRSSFPMSEQKVDKTRRNLIVATSVVGGAATVGAAVPLAASWLPSERAKAAGAPVEVDIAAMAPGELKVVEWRGKPVWILKRTKDMVEDAEGSRGKLSDPQSSASAQPDYARTRPAR